MQGVPTLVTSDVLEGDLVQPSSYSKAHIYVRYYC